MRLIRGLTHLEPLQEGCILTIGNFDGVHLGHRAILNKLALHASKLHLPVVVMIFEPQPLEYFSQGNAPARLMRLREKVIQFSKLPVDNLLVIKFNKAFADLEAEQFIEQILLEKLNVKHLVIGDDFHFGKARRGNFAMLKAAGSAAGFSVENTESHLLEGKRISSSAIRDALDAGNLTLAEKLLGHPYSIYGRIEHGEKVGRMLGFPTANIRLFRKNTPIKGVFAVEMTGIDDRIIQGVANVGTRPTLTGDTNVVLETHLFDFNKEIYGHPVEIRFKQKIRDEQRFDSISELKAQITRDIATAKQFFAELS
jgi:riboflavin kinase / FMN adenylyltransferase